MYYPTPEQHRKAQLYGSALPTSLDDQTAQLFLHWLHLADQVTSLYPDIEKACAHSALVHVILDPNDEITITTSQAAANRARRAYTISPRYPLKPTTAGYIANAFTN